MVSSSRPTTPNSQQKRLGRRQLHRSSGLYSVLPQSPKIHYPIDPDNLPLASANNLEKFEMLCDGMEELDVNMTNLQLIHEAISEGFNESFASFLYGLSITMWCVDFPGCPSRDQWEKLNSLETLDNRLQVLKSELEQKRLENEALKKRLARGPIKDGLRDSNANLKKDVNVIANAMKDRMSKPTTNFHSDDTYTTNEGSFVINPLSAAAPPTKIPEPGKTLSRIARPSTTTSNQPSSRSKPGPDLNQPPRYMRGLFDTRSDNRTFTRSPQSQISTTTTTTTKRNKTTISKLASRPPFR